MYKPVLNFTSIFCLVLVAKDCLRQYFICLSLVIFTAYGSVLKYIYRNSIVVEDSYCFSSRFALMSVLWLTLLIHGLFMVCVSDPSKKIYNVVEFSEA